MIVRKAGEQIIIQLVPKEGEDVHVAALAMFCYAETLGIGEQKETFFSLAQHFNSGGGFNQPLKAIKATLSRKPIKATLSRQDAMILSEALLTMHENEVFVDKEFEAFRKTLLDLLKELDKVLIPEVRKWPKDFSPDA